MKLNFAIVCDNAFVDQNNRLSIIQTFNNIFAENFPAVHTRLTIVSSFSKEDKDTVKQEVRNFTKIIDPNGKQIAESVVEARVAPDATQFISYFNGLLLKEPGDYLIKIILENDNEVSLPLHVIRSGKNSASAS